MKAMDELPPNIARIFAEVHRLEGGNRPAPLPEAYRRALEEIEGLPCNRSGQDKSWVLRKARRWRETIRNSRRIT
jgi:hypothetical protein